MAPLQHAYWAGGYDTDTLGGVSAHLYVELDGPDHDPATLKSALDTVVARHDMLRVTILNDGTQKVQPQPDTPIFSSLDLREANEATVAATLEDIRAEMIQDNAITPKNFDNLQWYFTAIFCFRQIIACNLRAENQ